MILFTEMPTDKIDLAPVVQRKRIIKCYWFEKIHLFPIPDSCSIYLAAALLIIKNSFCLRTLTMYLIFTAVQHERAPRCYQYKRDSPELVKDDKQPDIHTPFPSPVFLDRARYM